MNVPALMWYPAQQRTHKPSPHKAFQDCSCSVQPCMSTLQLVSCSLPVAALLCLCIVVLLIQDESA